MDNSMMGGPVPPMQGQGTNNGGMAMPMPSPSMGTGMPQPQGMPMPAPQNMNMSGQMPGQMPAPTSMPNGAMNGGNPMPPMPPEKKSHGTLVETIILVIVCLIAAGAIVAAVYFFMKYNDLSANYETEKNIAVADAKHEQAAADEAARIEAEKEPYNSFLGPSDYGSISFEFPKTWNAYIESDASGSTKDYIAYFAPRQVNSTKDKTSRYSLRFQILNKQVSDVEKPYANKAKSGALTSKVFAINGISGNIYEGELDKSAGIIGRIFIAKVNDKTLIMQTDAPSYYSDFEKVLARLRKN